VKHLLGLFSSLNAGQLEISPSKKDNIYAWKNTIFMYGITRHVEKYSCIR